ncbi:hypothetical protein C8R45DRAFT_1027603 [Mycena sanguinolenta]|nr:hypothetical protein C8R45DRAFT_1027603 [Mycena sanguinolenta]
MWTARGSYPCHSGAATAPSRPSLPLPICLALPLALALAQVHEPHVMCNPLFRPGGTPSPHVHSFILRTCASRISAAWRAAWLAPSTPTAAAVKVAGPRAAADGVRSRGQGRRIRGAGIGDGRPNSGSDCGDGHESVRHRIVDSSVPSPLTRQVNYTAPSPLSNPMRATSTDTRSPHPPLCHGH